MTTPIKIKIILGSTREGRFSEKPGRWILEQLKNVKGVDAEILDLRDYPLPFFNEVMSPTMAVMQKKYPYDISKKWSDKIAEGDAFIVISPEYNHGYSAVLKNAFDYTQPEWKNKPVGFVSYGGAGGARAIEQLRQVVIELQMAPIRNSLNIFWPQYMEVSKEKVGAKPSALDTMKDASDKFIEQLLWWASALKNWR